MRIDAAVYDAVESLGRDVERNSETRRQGLDVQGNSGWLEIAALSLVISQGAGPSASPMSGLEL